MYLINYSQISPPFYSANFVILPFFLLKINLYCRTILWYLDPLEHNWSTRNYSLIAGILSQPQKANTEDSIYIMFVFVKLIPYKKIIFMHMNKVFSLYFGEVLVHISEMHCLFYLGAVENRYYIWMTQNLMIAMFSKLTEAFKL